jgi:hypothetical protein
VKCAETEEELKKSRAKGKRKADEVGVSDEEDEVVKDKRKRKRMGEADVNWVSKVEG